MASAELVVTQWQEIEVPEEDGRTRKELIAEFWKTQVNTSTYIIYKQYACTMYPESNRCGNDIPTSRRRLTVH